MERSEFKRDLSKISWQIKKYEKIEIELWQKELIFQISELQIFLSSVSTNSVFQWAVFLKMTVFIEIE